MGEHQEMARFILEKVEEDARAGKDVSDFIKSERFEFLCRYLGIEPEEYRQKIEAMKPK